MNKKKKRPMTERQWDAYDARHGVNALTREAAARGEAWAIAVVERYENAVLVREVERMQRVAKKNKQTSRK